MIEFLFAGKSYQSDRIIGNFNESDTGPIIVFFGGIHGNEPSGIIALQRVFEELAANQIKLQGQIIGIAGNLAALSKNKRFISQDLNRIWNNDFTQRYLDRSSGNNGRHPEQVEQDEIFSIIEPLLQLSRPLYFIDLHTTSGPSVPFIAINDQLNNRNFALKFPVPTVLGIEEYLVGPLLTYLNDYGHVALAFEAGQHEDPESVTKHLSFIYLAMLSAGVIDRQQIPNFNEHQKRIENCASNNRGFFEVIFRKPVTENDEFSMTPGYDNFMPVQKGELLARDRLGEINSPRPARIFMPLYQSVGNDGYFLVREVPGWALKLSTVLRKINFDNFLTWLPGVSRSKDQAEALVVNKNVARFLATELFHLLGYRRKTTEGSDMIFSRREIQS